MPLSKETLSFLIENRLQNSREWFHQHKDAYRRCVLQPLTALAAELAPVMWEIDGQIVAEPKVGKAISHINRDTRFTKDKSLYREVMWLAYTRDKKRYPYHPGFFFEFSPDGFRYGCGSYYTPPAVMERLRQLVLDGDHLFTAARQEVEGQSHFQLEGDFYKRIRCPGQPEALRPWLERKNLDLIHNSRDFDLLFSPGLGKVLSDKFREICSFYAFLLAGAVEADVI